MVGEGDAAREVKSMTDYGYNEGFTKVLELWKEVFDLVNKAKSAGLDTILIANSSLHNVALANGKSFKRTSVAFQSRNNADVAGLVEATVDAAIFIKYEIKTQEKKGAFGGSKELAVAGMPQMSMQTRPTNAVFAKVRAMNPNKVPDVIYIQSNPNDRGVRDRSVKAALELACYS